MAQNFNIERERRRSEAWVAEGLSRVQASSRYGRQFSGRLGLRPTRFQIGIGGSKGWRSRDVDDERNVIRGEAGEGCEVSVWECAIPGKVKEGHVDTFKCCPISVIGPGEASIGERRFKKC